jgi:hypothetical protein
MAAGRYSGAEPSSVAAARSPGVGMPRRDTRAASLLAARGWFGGAFHDNRGSEAEARVLGGKRRGG